MFFSVHSVDTIQLEAVDVYASAFSYDADF